MFEKKKQKKIAIKCQKSDNLFSPSCYEDDDGELPEQRSFSSEFNNFDYNSIESPSFSSSFPPKSKEMFEYVLNIIFLINIIKNI